MYLKTIKVNGFKSFADNINIDFENGITGIVGPNGSGKSNIVDAVKWVLGEQSVKSLRGDGSMTDVIFCGSKSRNPSSSASVNLIFDNTDRYFPLDYTEVSIKRVVYRTGENEYFLNNEKCRLKDITNLIMDKGMGRDAFNIISQGNIQEILSNKPEDRRVIFEEAAGVLKYKTRKEEALRKLDRTKDNIDRLNDIINELDNQVEPLKTQSEKATIYLNTKEELENVEIALIVNDIEKMNNDFQNTKKEIDDLNIEILELSKTSTIKEASLEQEKLTLTKENDNIHLLQKELINLTSEVERLNGEKNLIVERSRYDSNDIKVHNHILELKEKSLIINNEIESSKIDSDYYKEEYSNLENIIKDINNNIINLKTDLSNIENERNNYIRKELSFKHQISILEQSIENNSSLPKSLKYIFDNPKLRGIHNIIGRLIKYEDKYKTAIDISLGASSLFLVVDNEYIAKETIFYLKENNLGRVTFFPLNIIKERTIDKDTFNIIKNHPSFIDIASNLVQNDAKYQNIILNQLGNVIVCKDIDGANEISKKINHRYRIVTLDGEMLHVGGSITGGNNKNNNYINEKYELYALNNNLKIVNDYINKLDHKYNDNNISLKDLELKNNNNQLELSKLKIIINNHEENITNLMNKYQNINNELNSLLNINNVNNEEDTIINSYYDAVKRRDEVEKNVNSLIKKVSLLNDNINNIEDNYRRDNQQLFKKQNIIKDLEIKVNRLDVKLDTLLNTLNEEYKMTFEKAKKEYILTIDDNEARKKVNNLKDIINDLGVINIASIEEYERVSKRYEFLIEQKNDLFKAENTLMDIIKEMDLVMKASFSETFKIISEEFKIVFKEIFKGGEAYLELTNKEDMLKTGIDIIALPPGKKLQHISLLSGGEKALTAISLLFAILRVRPVPFCILDEVEAALDEVNVIEFAKIVTKLKDKTQFIVITHKKKTMEYADVLYGFTMQESGVSKLVSVKLDILGI